MAAAKPSGKMPALGVLISSGPNKGSGGEMEDEEAGGSQAPTELAMKSLFRAFTKRDARAGAAALRHFIELTRDEDEEDAEY